MRVILAFVALLGLCLPADAGAGKSRKRQTARHPAASAAVKAQAVSYVQTRAASESTIENSAALVPFFERLWRAERGREEPVRILHFGDSHTAADLWTGRMRELLQARFGDGGSGFALAGKPFRGYRRYGQQATMSRGWTSLGLLQRDGDGIYGMGGVAVATNQPGETISLEGRGEAVELWYLRQPGGGSVRIVEEGETIQTISTDGPLEPGFLRFTPRSSQWQVVTGDRAPVRLFGWVTENPGGVSYESTGINGAQASIFGRWDAAVLESHIARRDPALIVLAYGTNEASNSNWTYESYRAEISTLLKQLRTAAPAASILLVGPPDRQYKPRKAGWKTFPRMNAIVAAQRDAALENRCAFWDLRERMGGEGAMTRWVQAGFASRDHVHFSAPGYYLIGDVLYRDIAAGYERFVEFREQSPPLPAATSDSSTGDSPTTEDGTY